MVTTPPELQRPAQPDGIGLAAMPIGINHIESVNVYIIEDGDSVTLVDCGSSNGSARRSATNAA